jgi:hypothetical protein
MSETNRSDFPRRYSGRVIRLRDDFGFISCGELDNDVYFRPSWYRGEGTLELKAEVTFEVKTFGDRIQAHNIARGGEDPPTDLEISEQPIERSAPTTEWLLHWAYLGYVPKALRLLAGDGAESGLALRERWEFKNSPADPERPAPILYSYLLNTFGRLVLEEKVLVSEERTFAAFNTGLVDRRYEPIHALFGPNAEPRLPWKLLGFCTAGEGQHGQNLVRHFNPLPQAAHYFDEPSDLLYDTRVGKPEMDWKHVVVDRIDRYPADFVEDHWPPGHAVQDPSTMTKDERDAYWRGVGAALEQDARTYRSIMNRVKDAVDLSVKRVAWNFKTAIPQYYPRVRKLQLLLPICLVSDDVPDMALTVERTPSGSYLGHTVLALDWAYKNARLICRPDSDWLAADQIDEGVHEEEPVE